jgi:hypothetical protein
MSSIQANKMRRPRARKARDGRSRGGALWLAGVMAASLAIAWLAGLPGWVIEQNPFARRSVSALADPQARTGLILFSSTNRDTCSEYLFDNVSGGMRTKGVVDCQPAIQDIQRNPAADRLNAITNAFRSK